MINSEEKYPLSEHDPPASLRRQLCPSSRCPDLDPPASNPRDLRLGKSSFHQISSTDGFHSSPEPTPPAVPAS